MAQTAREKHLKASKDFTKNMNQYGLIGMTVAMLALVGSWIISIHTPNFFLAFIPVLLIVIPINLYIHLIRKHKELEGLAKIAMEEVNKESDLKMIEAMLKNMPAEFRQKILKTSPELRKHYEE